MQPEHLRLLKELVVQVAGKNTEALIDILKGEKPVNEFRISEKLKLTVNQTRNILYKLYNQNIVFFIRKKDEKKGWYIYSWYLNVPKALERLKLMKEKEIDSLRHLLISRENKRFYKCPNECMEYNEETAMLHQFTCTECGSVLQLESTEELTKELKEKIEKAKKEIAEISEELSKIDVVRLTGIEKERLKKLAQRKRKRKAKSAKKRKQKAKDEARAKRKAKAKGAKRKKIKKKAKKKIKKSKKKGRK